MANEVYRLILQHRERTRHELEIGPSKDNIVTIFDTLLLLLRRVDDLDSRLTGLERARRKENKPCPTP